MEINLGIMTKDQLKKFIVELEKENRNLKSDLEQFSEAYKRYRDFEKEELAESCYDLAKENKNLKEDNEKLVKWNYDELQRLGLENYELREENKNLNIKVASLEWEIKWLNSVIDKLHKEIEEQEAEWGWLFDEIDYRKREAKRLWWKPNK